MAPNLRHLYPDLNDSDFHTAIGLFHQRYSTNTFPMWYTAQPFRMLAHNGEINTLQGNLNWMRMREETMSSPLFGAHFADLLPVVQEGGSDSAALDNVLELLVQCGRSPLLHPPASRASHSSPRHVAPHARARRRRLRRRRGHGAGRGGHSVALARGVARLRHDARECWFATNARY